MRILSGYQPTGPAQLGNFVGALLPYVEHQGLGDAFYFVADLHALTVQPDPEQVRDYTLGTAATMLAAGVDPERATLFVQSHVASEHAQLAWILQCNTTFGELRRMTQFKDKSEGKGDAVTAGLFAYPVLQVADVLLYDADRVPVGADQKQHLELVRNVAQRFNQRYGDTFVVPEPLIREVGGRVMDLQDPTRKMSTSNGTPKGTVWVLDEPDTILRKFRSAVTDSETEVRYDPAAKPGVSNLLDLLHVATGRAIDDLVAEYADAGYGTFKTAVGEAVVEQLRPVRERYHELVADRAELERVLARGAERASEVASATLARAVEKVGLLPPVASATTS